MTISYTDSLQAVTEAQFQGFFQHWTEVPAPALQRRLIAGSVARVLAIETASGRVVGFACVHPATLATGFLPLLEVLPEIRHQGIAEELSRRLRLKLQSGITATPGPGPFRLPAFRPLGRAGERIERGA